MGETKQPHLNGAYYGPSIPPPSKQSRAYHSHGRSGGGGCCCNPFSCLCSCLMNCLCTCVFQILCTLLVIAGILIFVLWLIFRPNILRFHVTDASLTEFNFNNNTLHYNLALNLTIRNPNRRVGVYYDQIEARAFYQGQRFAVAQVQPAPFYQGTKNTSDATVEFRGQNLVPLGESQRSNYNNERTSGVYDIDVQLHLRMRMRFWFVRSGRVTPRIDCDNLRIPLNANGTSNGVFETERCGFHW